MAREVSQREKYINLQVETNFFPFQGIIWFEVSFRPNDKISLIKTYWNSKKKVFFSFALKHKSYIEMRVTCGPVLSSNENILTF